MSHPCSPPRPSASKVHPGSWPGFLLGLMLACVPAPAQDVAGDAGHEFPQAYAITNARLYVAPGKVVEAGTIVIRRGVIEAVGPGGEVSAPFDAEVIDGKGLHVSAGFLDLFTTVGQRAGVERSATGRGRPVELAESPLATTPADNRRGLTPEFEVAPVLELPDAVAEPRRRLGFTALLSAPGGAIATGQSALASLGGLPRREAVVKSPVALHVRLGLPTEPPPATTRPESPPQQGPPRRRPGADREAGENPYPRSLMGAVAHLRQAVLDAQRHQVLRDREADWRGEIVPFDPALRALELARTRRLPVWWEAETRDEIHRALDLAAEFGMTAVIVGGREAGKVVDRLRAERVPVVVRLNFDEEEPRVPGEDEYRKRPLSEQDEPLRVLARRRELWTEHVSAATVLATAGVPIAFSSDGVERLDSLPARLQQLRAAGLTEEQTLAALTKQAAAIAGLEHRLGTLEVGKLGQVVAFSGSPFDPQSRVKLVLVDGLKFEIRPPEASSDEPRGGARRGQGPRPEGRATPPAPGRPRSAGGPRPDPSADPEKRPEPTRPAAREATPEPAESRKAADPKKPDPAGATSVPGEAKEKPSPPAPWHDVATEFDADRHPLIRTGGDVFIRDARILTVTNGTIARGSIRVEKGKIAAVGADLKPPPGMVVIEAAGLVAMPGMIDTHSHIAIQGGINETSLSVVPEVRVKDVVGGDDIAIYRALAGGTTTVRLLHGSANTIGGQDAVIKLRYGRPGRDLIVRDGPQGVKFALGENVTRTTGRFPNSRMGVEAVLIRAFEEARDYRAAWKTFEEARRKDAVKAGPPPRRDLRLEALAEILEGKIKIHSHCYRSDEILMLLQTAERFGIRVQSLQHVLEGYKVAAEIADHGASASTFSDWYAYKVEANDAIPFNAALLTRAGANVCIKSDSEELIRHLNLEAAKMVKYGGVSEEQALAMVTINPARELGLERRLGSIEPGKDADIALFNGHPLDAYSRCELALIDGEVSFQRPEPNGKLGSRPGVDLAMPRSPAEVRDRAVEFTPQPKDVFALVGATLHPVSAPPIKGGTLVVAGGKIAAVGPAGTRIPPEAQTIDLAGLDVWPGMIALGTTLGLSEVGSLRETQDFADSGRFQPELRTSVALRPESEHLPITRSNGVLAAHVQPSGGLIPGQGCLIRLNGWVPRELVIQDCPVLHVTIPNYVPRSAPGQRRGRGPGQGPGQGGNEGDPQARRREQLEAIRGEFRKALRHDQAVRQARDKGRSGPPADPRLAALAPYARGEKPVIFQAEHRNEILDALAIVKELKLKGIIAGADEGWKVAGELKDAGVPVLVGGTLYLPGQPHDPYDAPYANPARLHAAGVTLAIASRNSGASAATGARNLPYEAATAVAFGLPEEAALRAVTLAPAQILGVADQLGSLEVGKRGNLVITAGHLLQPTTRVVALFIDGRPVSAENRQTELYEKYLTRLREVRSGRAPLGLERPAPTPGQEDSRKAATGVEPGKRKAG
ncbi:MAG: amidohydrolase family protein [Isosphaeraceae bacterium]